MLVFKLPYENIKKFSFINQINLFRLSIVSKKISIYFTPMGGYNAGKSMNLFKVDIEIIIWMNVRLSNTMTTYLLYVSS